MAEQVTKREQFKTGFRKARGGRHPLSNLLERLTAGMVSYRDDFLGDLIRDEWQAINNGTAAADAVIVADQVGGEVVMNSGTQNDGYSGLSLSLSFQGQLNATMVARVKLDMSVDASIKAEIGFTDAHSDAGAVNVLASSSNTATDAVVWVTDSDDNANWQGWGTKNGTEPTKYEPAIAVADATWVYLMVALQDDTARFIMADANGGILADSKWSMADAVTKNVNLTPWLFVQNRGATQHNMDVDYVEVWQRRTTTS